MLQTLRYFQEVGEVFFFVKSFWHELISVTQTNNFAFLLYVGLEVLGG